MSKAGFVVKRVILACPPGVLYGVHYCLYVACVGKHAMRTYNKQSQCTIAHEVHMR